MPTYQSLDVLNQRPAISGSVAGGVIVVRGIVVVTAAILANDLFEAVRLPADHTPFDVIIETDDMDSGGPTITLDCGIMSGTVGDAVGVRTVGTEFLAASTIAGTGGAVRPTTSRAFRIIPAPFERSIGLKCLVAATTPVAPLAAMTVDRGTWQPSTAYAVADFIRLPSGRRVKCTTAGTSGTSFPLGLGTTLYNITLTDNTVTWTMGDPAIGVTLLYHPFRYGL